MFPKKKKNDRQGPLSQEEIQARLEQYCAYRDRCPKEVRSKLKELGASATDSVLIFDRLRGDKFFDEARFAMAYAGGKFRNNHWGKVRIKMELRQREIRPEIIEQALAAIDNSDYNAVLDKLVQKKLTQFDADPKAREKTAQSVIRSGFEPELVFRALKQ